MNARERKLANDAHYRRLANTAKYNQTFINPRYPTSASDYAAERPPEHLEEVMYTYHQPSYDMPMNLSSRPPFDLDVFPRYSGPPMTSRPDVEALSLNQNAMQHQMFQMQNALESLAVQQRHNSREDNFLSNHATGLSLGAAAAQLRAQEAHESHQEIAALRQQLQDQKTLTENEIVKRQEAEKKEQSAIKHQSILGREKYGLEVEVASLKERMDAALNERSEVARQLEDARRHQQNLERTCDSQRERMAAQASQAARYKDQMMSLRFTNEGMSKRVDELRREVENLFTAKNDLEEKNAKLEAELRQHKSKVKPDPHDRRSLPSVPPGHDQTAGTEDSRGGLNGAINGVVSTTPAEHATVSVPTFTADADPYAGLDRAFS